MGECGAIARFGWEFVRRESWRRTGFGRGTLPRRSGRAPDGALGEQQPTVLIGIARRQRDLDAGGHFGDARGDLERRDTNGATSTAAGRHDPFHSSCYLLMPCAAVVAVGLWATRSVVHQVHSLSNPLKGCLRTVHFLSSSRRPTNYAATAAKPLPHSHGWVAFLIMSCPNPAARNQKHPTGISITSMPTTAVSRNGCVRSMAWQRRTYRTISAGAERWRHSVMKRCRGNG